MKIKVAISVVPVICLCLLKAAFAQFSWEEIGNGHGEESAVIVDPHNPRSIYIGTAEGAILKTEDAGENWRLLLCVKGNNRKINSLLFDPEDTRGLFALTGNGVFHSSDAGYSWKRIFTGKTYLENKCTAFLKLPACMYAGTGAGLFVSNDQGRSWQRASGAAGNSCVFSLAWHSKEPHCIYAACAKGILRTQDSGTTWERIFVAATGDDETAEREDAPEEDDAGTSALPIRSLALDPDDAQCLYLATEQGVYKTPDGGTTWSKLSDNGLLNNHITSLVVQPSSELYAITPSAIFSYHDELWTEESSGLVGGTIRCLHVDRSGNLYAACKRGLFRTVNTSLNGQGDKQDIGTYCKDEPSISDVQHAAVQYAELESEKIIRWRKQAAFKAWLPEFNAGINRNVTDLWHWEGGSTTKPDDDTLVKGRDSIAWDVSLTWNLGDLIWNNDQTSIDVRSRLLVQLREDILDQVTKIYFERLRVKIELAGLLAGENKRTLGKEIRLQELTASLDALTNGYFSKNCKRH